MSIRAASLFAARPYIAYVDEGNFLRPVTALLRDGGWDPHWYLYPQLPIVAVTAVLRAWAPLHDVLEARPLRDELSGEPGIYDLLEPFDVLVAARAVGLLLEAAIILLTGLFARRLAGPRAGVAAVWLAALTPALAIRGAIATVDPYAVLFTLISLILVDATRTSPRPGLAALGSGAAAGFAFASKYPSVIVVTALAATTLLLRTTWTEKQRRLALGGAGLIGGAALAMPALVAHPAEVLDALRTQAALYSQIPSPPLWRQALLRAEWDLPFEGPELGPALCALALAGLAVAVGRRDLRATAGGWIAYGSLALPLYARRTFQPFRNVLPLVPVLIVAVAILYVPLRARIPRPEWLDAAALTWMLAAFGLPLAGYARSRLRLEDTRTQAVNLLMDVSAGSDVSLFQREIGFLDKELERLPRRPAVVPGSDFGAHAARREPRILLVGVRMRIGLPPVDVSALPGIRENYAVRLRFGDTPTVPVDGWWRGNRQIVYVLERREGKWRRGRDLNPW